MRCRLQGSSKNLRNNENGGSEALTTESFPKESRCVRAGIIVERLCRRYDCMMGRPFMHRKGRCWPTVRCFSGRWYAPSSCRSIRTLVVNDIEKVTERHSAEGIKFANVWVLTRFGGLETISLTHRFTASPSPSSLQGASLLAVAASPLYMAVYLTSFSKFKFEVGTKGIFQSLLMSSLYSQPQLGSAVQGRLAWRHHIPV